jgi:D-alanine-D-alanine ligase
MKIGFTYDLKEDHRLRKGMPQDAYAELDREESIVEIAQALASGGDEVVRLGHVHRLLKRLPDVGVDIVFNICEGLGNRNRESEVPVLLDLFGIPYVGSDGMTLGLTLDKGMAKKVFLADGVPTPKFFIATERTDFGDLDSMRFPFIVKPLHEGSSKGISEGSIVGDRKALKAQALGVIRTYRQPALVEEFISGSEFTVLVIGNEPPQALPPVQIEILGRRDLGRLVYTSRRLTGPDIRYVCPASISRDLDKNLRALAVRAYQSVGCRDFGRVDFRVDGQGRPYVLEINPLPSLSTEDVFPLVAQEQGWTYDELIVRIVDIAARRCGIKTRRKS